MNSFRLKIVTPSGLAFDGPAEELIVRTTTGDLGILAGHLPCVAPLGMGRATVITEGKRRYAACIGGMVSVMDGHVNLVPTSFEWAEDIDPERVADSERLLFPPAGMNLRVKRLRVRRVEQRTAQHGHGRARLRYQRRGLFRNAAVHLDVERMTDAVGLLPNRLDFG